MVRGVSGVGWDEFATIRMATGQTRHGLVLEVDRDLAVVQVLEGTEGMRPDHDAGRLQRQPAADSGRDRTGSAGCATGAANRSTAARP